MHLESLHTILSLVVIYDLDIVQFDIMSTYLHGTLKEELYVKQPDSHKAPGEGDYVWRFKKGLYSLVQVGRTRTKELNSHMMSIGLTTSLKDPAIYVKGNWNQHDFIARGFWVDDFRGIGSGKGLQELARVDEKYGITDTEKSSGLWGCS